MEQVEPWLFSTCIRNCINSPQLPKKCVKNSMENMYIDVRVQRVISGMLQTSLRKTLTAIDYKNK